MNNQSNRSEGDFDFGSESDQSKEESKSKHSQSSEESVETFKHKRTTSNTRTDNKTIINMKKIREAREFELYKKKLSIIDVCSVLISSPLRGVVIRNNILARVSKSLPLLLLLEEGRV